MTIFGIEGGIGTGKTLTLVYYGLEDLKAGKTLFSNIKFKNLPKKLSEKIKYLDVDLISNIFEHIKTKTFDMKNSTVLIQEAHNYVDSRNSQSKRNKTFTYWILQSRHTGEGSCDIMFDTQELGQVDLRLRRNTDFVLRPSIIQWVKGRPTKMLIEGMGKIMHKYQKFNSIIDVSGILEHYDTHQIVEF